MTRVLQRFLAFFLLVSPSTLLALGLGEIQLHSALNEPLVAEIELLSAAPDELSSLRAGLATRETFTRYGLERPQFLQNIEFKVGRGRDGRNVLQVRSREAITEPFLSFLVEVNWSRGRLLREYTLLMDPPVYMPGGAQVASAPVSAPQAGPAEAQPSAATTQPLELQPPPPEPSGVSRPPVAPVMIDGSSYTVRTNDTLWQIASSLKPGSGSDINRMMMALYRSNPEAFGGNINHLRAGAILRLPGDAEFEGIAASEANAEVRRQYAEWRASRGIAEGAAPSDARLRLVTPADVGEGVAAPSPAAAAESQQLRDRVRQLETQLDESRRMIELKDRELAQLQQRLGQAPPVEAQAPEAEPAPAEPPVTAADADQAPTVEPTPAAEPEVTEPPAAEPAAEAPVTTAAPERSWIDWLLENWYYPLAALLIVGGVVFGLTRRRQEAELASFGKLADAARAGAREQRFERAPLERSAPERAPVTAPRRTGPAADSAFLVEESGEHLQPRIRTAAEPARVEKPKPEPVRAKSADETLSSETAINLDQGDPLAEADFHMAYGLYDQAADLVRIAIEREPERRDLKLKLLEIFFVWGNKDAFLQAARELADTRSLAAPGEWDKISIMGRQISPDDPLFAHGAGEPAPQAAEVDLNLEGGENRVDLDLLGSPEGERAGAIDLDLGAAGGDEEGASSGLREGEAGLDFVFEAPGRSGEGSATTREMTARTQETPTIESEAYELGESPTIESSSLRQRESTTIREKLNAAMLSREGMSPDQTAELALDDLGLEVDQLSAGDTGSLSDLEATDHPSDAPTLLAGLDERSRRALENADTRPPARDREPTVRSKSLAGEEKISPTGTWVLDDKTLAATVALPGAERGDSTSARVRALAGENADTARRRRADSDATAELSGLSGEEMDLDLDRLEAALQSDTLKQRKGSAAEDGFASDVFGAKDLTETDLDLDVGEVARDRDRAPTGTARIPADEMGLPELEPVTMSEVGTKLDLARAYMDMGDPEGARSILEEVLQEGSATQKQEAQRLIDSLPG